MKQGKVVLFPMILVAVLCIVGLIGGLIYVFLVPETEKPKEASLFAIGSLQELTESGFTQSLDGSYEKNDAKEFGVIGTMIAREKDGAVTDLAFTADLLTGDSIKITEAESAVAEFVESYSKALGFPILDEPKMLQFADDETYKNCPENEYEALIGGYVLFEYSYRDAVSILWIVQIYSPKDQVLSASVMKYPDASGFTDYEAMINLQRK